MDEIDRAKFDEFELAHPELALDLHDTMNDAPRLSPAAARFMAGDMEPAEARALGFTRDVGEDG